MGRSMGGRGDDQSENQGDPVAQRAATPVGESGPSLADGEGREWCAQATIIAASYATRWRSLECGNSHIQRDSNNSVCQSIRRVATAWFKSNGFCPVTVQSPARTSARIRHEKLAPKAES